ncbi:4Fe-4S binding protein [Candidatus Desantisbacteria bacterium]|nr:4Fe-4S binding protein [Candidatus Desantisbacteria bacterium]
MKNLLDRKLFRNTIEQGIFPVFFQILTFAVLIFILIITWPYHNIQGVSVPDPLVYTNLGNLLFWICWMMGIIIFILIWGRLWCAVCPLGMINSLFSRIGFKYNYPQKLRNWYLLIVIFVILQISINMLKINHFPDLTAYLIIIFILAGILAGLFFQDRILCRYLCPIGSMIGVYSCFSPMELRVIDKKICAQCLNKECIKGKTNSYNLYFGSKKLSFKKNSEPCPAQIYPAILEENTHCFFCGKCIKNCPNNNIRWNYRTYLKEILTPGKKPFSETLFIILLLGMILDKFVPLWPGLAEKIFLGSIYNPILSYLWIYLILPGLAILIPPLLVYLISNIKIRKVENVNASNLLFRSIKLDEIIRYSTGIYIPLIFFSHLALAIVKLSTRGNYLIYGLADPAGVKTYRAIYLAEILSLPSNIISIEIIRWILIILISTGAAISFSAVFKITGSNQFEKNKPAFTTINFISILLLTAVLLLIIKFWLFG